MKKRLLFIVSAIVLVTALPLTGCPSLNVETGAPDTIFHNTTAPATIPPVTTQPATTVPKTTEPQDTAVYSGGPIYIQGDKSFNHANGVVRGTGTQSDPYIIEGWTIEVGNGPVDVWPYVNIGIIVDQTTKYYVIRNCIVSCKDRGNAYTTGISAGDNGRVENCTVNGLYTGITNSGSNTVIDSNTITNCETGVGIGLYVYNNFTISNNDISGCTDSGIDFGNAEDSRLESNTITSCSTGIDISSVFNCTVSKNIIRDSDNDGITVGSAFANSSVIVDGNEVTGSRYTGISVYCSNNVISNNTVTGGRGMGISLDNVALISDTTSQNLVTGNTVNNNAADGIRVTCPHNTISNNTALSNNTANEFYADRTPRWVDLYVEYLQYNTLENNTYGTSMLMESR